MNTREQCAELDRNDPLAPLAAQFILPTGVIYLDGNSLGALPAATAARVQEAVALEWGQHLISAWNSDGWIHLAGRVGDKIARLIGAAPGEVMVADSTSVNTFKVLSAALSLAPPERRVVLTERDNFPTDLYIASRAAQARGATVRMVDADEIESVLRDDRSEIAVLLLTQVNYRTGLVHDMAALTAAAHGAGALAVWDLSHSAGAIEVDVNGADADFAIGCGYKYLNGGPGAPAYVWSNRRVVDRAEQPLAGWLGHRAPFDFETTYTPAPGIARFQCGTPPILSLVALDCGVDTVLAAAPFGGMAALRAKSMMLGRVFIEQVADIAELALVSPADDSVRGSQVSLAHADGAYAIMQALISRGVIGDFRAPDVLRFGFAPLYTTIADVWDAANHLHEVIASGEWRDPRFAVRAAVT